MNRPNILFIVLDSARAETVYSMLDGGDLPGLEKFADDGSVYRHAFANSPWTLPSHASMFTGQRTSIHESHAGTRNFDPSVPPLPELLSKNGYETRGISANAWISAELGFDRGFDNLSMKWERFWRGPDLTPLTKYDGRKRLKKGFNLLKDPEFPFALYNLIWSQVLDNSGDFGAETITRRTEKWLRRRERSQPYFYFINFMEPHLPYEPPSKYIEEYSPRSTTQSHSVNQDAWGYVAGNTEMEQQDFETLRGLYQGEIAYLDDFLEQIFHTLKETGYLDTTAVFIVGDHGENIGDHGLMDHQYSLHDTVLHVPLVVRYPTEFESADCFDMIELRDLYPTIAHLGEAEIPAYEGISSVNLVEEMSRDKVIAEYRYPQPDMESLAETVNDLIGDYEKFANSIRSIRTSEWKLIQYEDGRSELFPAGQQTEEVTDDHPDVESELSKQLDQEEIPRKRGSEEKRQLAKSSKERLEDLGYV